MSEKVEEGGILFFNSKRNSYFVGWRKALLLYMRQEKLYSTKK